MGTAGSLSLRGEVRYQSSVFFDQFDTAELEQKGYAIINGRLTYLPDAKHWNVSLYGQNLADKVYRASVVRVDNVFGSVAFMGTPRTYGLEVQYRN